MSGNKMKYVFGYRNDGLTIQILVAIEQYQLQAAGIEETVYGQLSHPNAGETYRMIQKKGQMSLLCTLFRNVFAINNANDKFMLVYFDINFNDINEEKIQKRTKSPD